MGAPVITLDTHAAVWWTQQPGELSSAAVEVLEAADQILVPSIVFWEVALLVRKQRLRLGHGQPVGSWARTVLAIPRVREAPLDHRIALAADAADMHPDPADRFIATTAMAFDAPLITKDRRMRDLGWLNTIW
jgi:PIN domain nuclease of toxin-antitoxin system